MRDYLAFQLYGHFSSWGDIAVGETRPSFLTPGKSAIIGLLSAALGIKRPDTVENENERDELERQHSACANGYGIAFHTCVVGTPLTDYHTTQMPSSGTGRNRKTFSTRRDELTWSKAYELHTVLSRREYHQDMLCRVALWPRKDAPYSLDTLRDALNEPVYTLYLGRKSCPLALPLAATVIKNAENIEYVFSHFVPGELDAITFFLNKMKKTSWLLWDTDAEVSVAYEDTVTRRDVPLSRRRWQFMVREEHHTTLSY